MKDDYLDKLDGKKSIFVFLNPDMIPVWLKIIPAILYILMIVINCVPYEVRSAFTESSVFSQSLNCPEIKAIGIMLVISMVVVIVLGILELVMQMKEQDRTSQLCGAVGSFILVISFL